MTNTKHLNAAIDALRYTVTSLNGCKAVEVNNEARLVADAINNVKSVQFNASPAAIARAVKMIGYAIDALSVRRA